LHHAIGSFFVGIGWLWTLISGKCRSGQHREPQPDQFDPKLFHTGGLTSSNQTPTPSEFGSRDSQPTSFLESSQYNLPAFPT
jgi:hypothetical protein